MSFLRPLARYRTSLTRLVTAMTTIGITALGLMAGTAGAARAAATPAASAIATLMQSYDSSTGLMDTNSWWQSAVALSTVMTYRQATGDTSYDYAISTTFNDNGSNNFEDAYMDDTGWWAVAWLQAYDITGNTAYLQMAETDATYMHSYWDSTCGGGIWWSTARTYKNAIANELFLEVTAALHNRIPGDTTYLGWASAEWDWFSGSGMINGSHLVNDGLTSSCQNNGETTWTYNQGVILAGLSALYQATGNAVLLTTAESIANAATTALTTNGVLVEPCEPNCGADGPSFKGSFVRGLRTLASTAGTTAYDAFFQAQAVSIEAHDTNSAGQIGLDWAGPVQGLTFAAQASGADALVAALSVPGSSPVTGPVASGMSGKCLDDYTGSAVNGTKADLWDCNGGTNQQWTASNGTLVNPASGKCLDDPAFSTTNGTQLDIWDCNGGANQQWTLPAS